MCRPAENLPRRGNGFSLVELLVVIAILGILLALLFPALQAARESSRKTICASNLRQLGLAMIGYCDQHRGWFPRTTHDTPFSQSWIQSLAPYVEHVDAIRICPDDELGRQRLAAAMTSYALNSYVTNPVLPGAILNRDQLPSITKTMIAFELTDRANRAVGEFDDHVEAHRWFTASNIAAGTVLQAIEGEIDIGRHAGGSHYLHADGTVVFIPASTIEEWARKPFPFVKPEAASEQLVAAGRSR